MAVTIGYIFVTQKIIPLKHFDLYAQNNIQIDFNTIKIILEYPKRKFCNFSSKTALQSDVKVSSDFPAPYLFDFYTAISRKTPFKP